MSTSPTTLTGTKYTPYQNWLTMVATWPTVALGATSVVVTVVTAFHSQYAVSDSSNSFTTTVNGTTNTEGSHTISHGSSGGTTTLYSKSYTIPISQTVATNVSLYANLSGIEYITGGHADVSGTLSIPASGVPYSHPVVTAGTYNFANLAQILSFVVTGGAQYHIASAEIHVYTDRTGTTDAITPITVTTFTTSGSNRYITLLDAQRALILGAWQHATATKEITRIGIIVTTHYDTSETAKVHSAVYLLPPTFAQSYNTTAFTVTRGALTGDGLNTIPQALSATVNAATTDPFYQAGLWPTQIWIRLFRGTTELTTLSHTHASPNATWTKSDATNLAVGSTQAYSAKLYNGTTLDTTTTYTVPAADSFISLVRGATLADHRVGIGTGNPQTTLDVEGIVTASSGFTTPGHVGCDHVVEATPKLTRHAPQTLTANATVNIATANVVYTVTGTGLTYIDIGDLVAGDIVEIGGMFRAVNNVYNGVMTIYEGGTTILARYTSTLHDSGEGCAFSAKWACTGTYTACRVYMQCTSAVTGNLNVMAGTAPEHYTTMWAEVLRA
jgi:hypothetical protein